MDSDLKQSARDLGNLINSANGCLYTDLQDGNAPGLDPLITSRNNVMNYLHLNIRSIHKNLYSLTPLLSELQDQGVIVHVLGLCETYLTDSSLQLIDIENYASLHCVRKEKTGGGVSIYVHDTVKIMHQINTPFDECFESIVIELYYHGQKFFFSEFYRVPNTNDKLFMNSLTQLLDCGSTYKRMVVCSDQNYDLKRIHHHCPIQDFINCMHDNKFILTISVPTRVTHTTGTIIHNIYVRHPTLNRHSSFVVTDGMSDHFPCLLMYQVLSKQKDSSEITIEKRKINGDIIMKVQQKLLFHDWSPVYTLNASKGYKYIVNIITNALECFAPKKIVKIRSCNKFRDPWMTVKIKRYNMKCRRLCNKAQISGKTDDYHNYKRYRNTLNRIKLHERKIWKECQPALECGEQYCL